MGVESRHANQLIAIVNQDGTSDVIVGYERRLQWEGLERTDFAQITGG